MAYRATTAMFCLIAAACGEDAFESSPSLDATLDPSDAGGQEVRVGNSDASRDRDVSDGLVDPDAPRDKDVIGGSVADAMPGDDTIPSKEDGAAPALLPNGYPIDPPSGCGTPACFWHALVPCLPSVDDESCVSQNHPDWFGVCYSSGPQDIMWLKDPTYRRSWLRADGSVCVEIARDLDVPGFVFRVRDGKGRLLVTITRDSPNNEIRHYQCAGEDAMIRYDGTLCPAAIRINSLVCEEGMCPR